MNSLICERSRELQQSNSQSKAPRGKRLPNKTGLNIIDDNLVYTTIKENEEKKRQSQEPLLEKCLLPPIHVESGSYEQLILQQTLYEITYFWYHQHLFFGL